MMTTNVDDKALGMSARHFHIASRSGDDDNNYWQQRTTSVGRRGLVREHKHILIALHDGNDNVKHTFYVSNIDTTTSQATSNLDAHELYRQT